MKSKINKNKNQQGFTLIEIIMATAIVIFLSATMFQIISVSDTQRGLILNAEKVKSVVRLAQAYSLSIPPDSSQRDVCGFGIHIDETGKMAVLYYLYNKDYQATPEACGEPANFDYPPSDSGLLASFDEKKINLDSDYKLSGDGIFFQAPYGRVYSGNFKLSGGVEKEIKIENIKTNQSETITINGGGKINL